MDLDNESAWVQEVQYTHIILSFHLYKTTRCVELKDKHKVDFTSTQWQLWFTRTYFPKSKTVLCCASVRRNKEQGFFLEMLCSLI